MTKTRLIEGDIVDGEFSYEEEIVKWYTSMVKAIEDSVLNRQNREQYIDLHEIDEERFEEVHNYRLSVMEKLFQKYR
jgi:hypothetical protein